MFQLQIGSESFQKITDFPLELGNYTEFQQVAIQFCREWLSGNDFFDQQSSGSTGIPKINQITRQQMYESALATGAFFKANTDSQLLCCLNPAYIAGKMMLVRAMVWNSSVRLITPSSNPLIEISPDQIPSFVALAPYQVQTILEHQESLQKLKRISNIIIGGAPLSDLVKKTLISQKIKAFQTYGMTETVSHIALAPIEQGEITYQTLQNVEIGQDHRGALWTRSPMTCGKKIQTNDLIELLEDGRFRWLGRVDFVINSGGIKIHPELLEHKTEKLIFKHFGNVSYFFYGLEDLKLGQKLVLLIETNSQSLELLDGLNSDFKNKLEWYEVPKKIYLIPRFEQTPSGKIDRIKTTAKL
jgi:O-succinylbenzoic acid--CoA ligase